ncbi:hypothetical protein G9A89_015156 [Geosiphon pyriformis]|nr:hypothetical protein G9A89_015156 [Geosiphon pyriformis]
MRINLSPFTKGFRVGASLHSEFLTTLKLSRFSPLYNHKFLVNLFSSASTTSNHSSTSLTESNKIKLHELTQILLPICNNSLPDVQQELKWLSLHVVNNLRGGQDRSKHENYQEANNMIEAWERMGEHEKYVLNELVKQRAQQFKPLQYILGTQPFCNLDIVTRPPVLIPRWETEEWTDRLTKLLIPHLASGNNRNPSKKFKIIDICTGSGCVALALSHNLPAAMCKIHAIDNAPDALMLASLNLRQHQELLHNPVTLSNLDIMKTCDQDLRASIEKTFDDEPPKSVGFDLIVSNPPYVSTSEYESLGNEVKLWEDKRALVADEDGVAFHMKIAKLAKVLLKKGIQNEQQNKDIPRIVMEIGGEHQVPKVYKVLQENGFSWVKVWKDGAGKDRSVIAG